MTAYELVLRNRATHETGWSIDKTETGNPLSYEVARKMMLAFGQQMPYLHQPGCVSYLEVVPVTSFPKCATVRPSLLGPGDVVLGDDGKQYRLLKVTVLPDELEPRVAVVGKDTLSGAPVSIWFEADSYVPVVTS